MGDTPVITLNNGVTIPQIGFGVFQIPEAQTAAAVTTALEAGYRSIDTAAIYHNESGVGEALKSAGVPRDDLFITTKVWNTDQGYDETLRAFDASTARLGVDRLDLYLIHWPTPKRGKYLDTWRALEKLLADGRVRAIGVSNFLPEHLRAVADLGGTVPAVNQIEVHPALQQRDAQAANAELGVITEAWSPLAQAGVLGDPAVLAIATDHDRTPAQVVLRWHVQQGRIVIPKSVTPSRIAENLRIFDFELSADELAAIDALESDGRTGPHPDHFN
ncbi:aldo/keto reductase [Actinoplanes xinjiangensis]|jgi:2,5-diketo-D-gluconate reductase A|uniref:2,5-diketo-D-gluconate reductase A n=1 Tax=Actinoplanes xinjiangensis TaxID=512350 RepID=A0A316FY51_9ACTN|nr:aldo/keto reductase [Actinoplanes xinjiangensis]PWK52626.1 2,5-diketo-D-gluconate reductase A [Actinoplanes xinjiangensis]GIF36677.1 oxidoreductase [Actinoplanes xinjiangensis]